MKRLTIYGVQSYPTRALFTKQLGTIPLTEEKYQEFCLKSGIITDEFKASLSLAVKSGGGDRGDRERMG
jgi:hypothetical protein